MRTTKKKLNRSLVAFDNGDLAYALDNAAEFLENEEWPDDGGQQKAANLEAAKRILRMSKRLPP